MKRFSIFLLTLMFALQSVSSMVYANETEDVEVGSEAMEIGSQDSIEADLKTEQIHSENVQEYASLDVRILQGLVGLPANLTVKLQSQTSNDEIHIQINDENTNQVASFIQLEAGSYTLHISGIGYTTYTQQIEMDTMHYELSVYAFGMGVPGYGSMVFGDLNQDGKVDRLDVITIIDAIDAKQENGDLDINHDGILDMIDVQLMINLLEQSQTSQQADITSWVPLDYVNVITSDENTKVSHVDALLNQTGHAMIESVAGNIGEDNPVQIGFELQSAKIMDGLVLASDQITGGTVTIIDEQGKEYTFPIETSGVFRSSDGTIEINLGQKIAVKKVTIKINQTKQSTSLVEISKVEFVNGMDTRIPMPELNIPDGLSAKSGNKEFTLSWNVQTNVSGYEVLISQGQVQEVKKVTVPFAAVSMFQNQKLKNGVEYKVKVRSINGQWKSEYSNEITVVCKTDSRPDAPDSVKAQGAYQAIHVTWKAMEDTDTYELYYKEESKDGFEKVSDIHTNSYTLKDLKDNTSYIVYVVGINEFGSSSKSLEAKAKTSNVMPATLPAYQLINTSTGTTSISNHVVSATHSHGMMVNSKFEGALGLFDNDYSSYLQVNDWDNGGSYPDNNKGVTVSLDQTFTIGMIAFAEVEDTWNYSTSDVRYFDENNQIQKVSSSILQKTDENGRKYYLVTLQEPVTTSKIKLGVGHPYGHQSQIRIAEMRLYEYDSIEHDIFNLYADDLRLTLKDDVTLEKIEELASRLNTKDPVCDEYHPKREALQKELDAAKDLLETKGLKEVIDIHSNITMKKNANVSGLNAWQPLGISAAAQEEIVVYVGHPNKKTGDGTDLALVATQFYAENDSLSQTVQTLKIGRNEITIPAISSENSEQGGPLYIEYTGNKDNDAYSVRVSGGTSIPVLDLYDMSDQVERLAATNKYITALKSYVDSHKLTKDNILNTTDILMDHMMLSLPATQVLNGSNADAKTLLTSMDAMDDMMLLFYQHKGLTNSFVDAANAEKNSLPNAHLNIRYMKMFSKAFMYAAGNHIGIEYDQTKELVNCKGVQIDGLGRKLGGSYFGWGIAHEIGHNINQSQYAVAEVTNNYFSMLATTDHTNQTARFDYDVVYDHVTSQSNGAVSDVFLQLAMYWQLHLVYDNMYSYKQFDTYEEIVQNRFYARVDSYARNPGAAPSPNGVSLSLGNNVYQNFMRLASAAAQKDLTEFFTQWGFVPNEDSKQYMEQFEKESRAIWYINDDAKTTSMGIDPSNTIAGKDVVNVSLNQENSRVTLAMNGSSNYILGYEILRTEINEGRSKTKVVGFTTSDTYTDVVTGLGNRTVSYTVRAVDIFLNRSKDVSLEAVKLDGDGLIDSKHFEASTNMESHDDQHEEADNHDPCAPTTISAITRVIDGKRNTQYVGMAQEDASILIDMKSIQTVNGLRLIADRAYDLIVEVSQDGKDFKKVSQANFDGKSTMYFNDEKKIVSYDARYVRLTFKDSKDQDISIKEVEIIAPNGDNVTLDGVGYLKEDYTYTQDGKETIQKGSLVFTGSYKGNPAYNVVLVYDEHGNIVGGTDKDGQVAANQIILAPDPEDALLGDTSDGTWIYWIDPDALPASLPNKVRVELYRVDDALTNEGQRLVSDTLWFNLDPSLPSIEITTGEKE